ncbi:MULTISPECIES: S4 domain-containing protein [Brevibacillus]|uniref:Cytoplasmic protein n=1 Tax=Brevibacillus porteri TaxID=2126350 RepID=A0ABX5FP36_9BACL|nr:MULTISPECIES: S4 domain-containing protein [Brevibacillus]MDC0764079.1 S4 domain-containing protein [Brevibacillus sp. AG]MED1800214.1 S4 domain-containing protein [Brevibacillus porteri]MED2133612.1 S4 domain-containing protein [Brevibacillus porteri]MED2747304.1 S4 domain-containing protein [Brevibacillus porteri]MED2813169.1 S4 domain-containing protein [Brevibacillus porteri]
MHIIEHTWVLREIHENQPVRRHCSNCGRIVLFFDTNIRRHNANGKNIYRFAIYKCEKNHTWNEKLAIYKAFTDHREVPDTEFSEEIAPLPTLPLHEYQEKGVQEVTIRIERAEARFRLDKLLSEQIEGWSRSEIVRKIKDGHIRLNEQETKPSAVLSAADIIQILIE